MARRVPEAGGPGRVNRELRQIRRTAQQDRAAKRTRMTTIGSEGLRVKGGNIYVDEGGSVIIDGGDVEVVDGSIVAGVKAGRHAEFSATGYRLINANGGLDIDLTTTGDNRVLLVNPDGHNILLSGGTLTGDSLNVNAVTVNGESLHDMIVRISKSDEATPDPDPPAGTVRRSQTFTANWHQAYNGSGNPIAGPPTQGYSPYSQHGNQRSLIGFPEADIAAALANATQVTKARLHIYYAFWHSYSGGTAVIGYHDHNAPPGSFSGFPDRVRKADFPRGAWRWIDLPDVLSDWKDGDKEGIAIGPGPSTSTIYYGEARGAGSAVLELSWEEPG